MVTSSHSSTTQPLEPGANVAFPFLALTAIVAAAAMFGGAAIVLSRLGGRDLVALMTGLAGSILIFATICLLIPPARGAGLLFAWNGLGLGVGLLLLGIFSVGALVAFPLAMIAIALSSWPRAEHEPLLNLPAVIAQVGGFLTIVALPWAPETVGWMADRLGGS